ncbi:MAG: methyltransferase domain-containing protein [Acidobacteria bacterium]|nr:methyltransferase domain-containing protein [Acidobacteriota bacterium]
MWNRLRYTFWAPAYDAIAGAAGFDAARRLSIGRLQLTPGDRVLIVGAGTGLDLEFLPSNVHVTAIDVTPAMLKQLERRAAGAGRAVTTRIMDARQLAFPDSSFDAVVMHLILAVMPQPERGLREAVRVLKPGGRIAVFDKFLRDEEHPSLKRRLLNALAKPLFSDLNRRLGPLMAGTPLVIEHDEPVAFGGAYRIATLVSPGGGSPAAGGR